MSKFRLPLSPLTIVVVALAIEVMGGGLLFPVLPFLVAQFKSDALTIGALAASFSTAQFLAAPILGSLSDRVGRRPVLIVCTFGTALAFFLLGIAQSLWLMFVAQIVNGITGGLVSTAQAYIADVSESPQERTQNFGLIGAAFGIGFILGPLLGGALAGISLKLPVFLAGAVALLNSIFAYRFLPESIQNPRRSPLTRQDFNPLGQLWDLLRRPQLRNLLVGYFLFFLAFSGFTNIFVVWVRDRFAWGPIQSGGVLFWVGVISSLVQGGLIRKLLPRFGEFRLTLAGFSAAVLAYGILTQIPAGYYLYGTQTLFALGIGVASPSIRGIISTSVSDAEQGKVSGGSLSLASLTQILGPLIAGWSYDHWHPNAPLYLGGVLALLALGAIATSPTAGNRPA
ncbi:MFS transporter [Lyngbya confervoides]|uniref:MFS transporter n=1 Tax=Lyngbya confervoides BDU141951 TaxID=1574623 RepID=A0ABD4TAK0_9CYAN|nr:MFS transporter [Lyngbya confervoides]MCM1985212.1 MFS transporter [Lyngbya confervoides BDU141951]